MKTVYILICSLLVGGSLMAQCPTVEIDRSTWSIHSFDTEETTGEGPNNGRAIHTIDGNNSTFWHTRWQNFTAQYPHFIAVDMGAEYDISGVSFTSRFDNNQTKPKDYELFLSTDGVDWGLVQSAGTLQYDNPAASGQETGFNFAPVTAKYFKLVFHSAYDNGPHSAISEIYAVAVDGSDGCTATGQNNQIISFDPIAKQYTDSEDLVLNASANTELPITYVLDSGPAILNGDVLSFTGESGSVVVSAIQEGNAEYYAATATQSFEVVDLSTVMPEVHTGLLESSPVLMPELMPYKLYASAQTEESEALNITHISFSVNGDLLESINNDGYYSAWWTPSEYGEHNIVITATSSNGMQSQMERNLTVSNAIETTTAPTLQNAVIDWGTIGSQWYYGTYQLPQSVGAFESIMADFIVTCPGVPGGCDDWDRLAYVQIKNRDGNWIELFRYITPFGRACSHSIDVTDYESVLQGQVEFRVYIETWGTGGWKMDLNLTYQAGTPEYTYTAIQEVWHGTYNFGDPANLQPMPQRTIDAPDNTEIATFRLVTTGHGWGQNNTGNAAEFYFATHRLKVDGANTFTQNMKVICNPNPDGCSPQFGTWQHDRAGWCPGTIPSPYTYDLTPHISSAFTFDYEFQPSYQDHCHPNNPNCVTGQTCPDCNDGYNPHYRIGGYAIYKSNTVLNVVSTHHHQVENLNQIELFPNPNSGTFNLALKENMKDLIVQIFDIKGVSIKTYFFKNNFALRSNTFNLQDVGPGVYFIKVYNTTDQYSTRLVVN